MESLEGKRGVPRIKPPFPAVVGLYGGPTVINNAETIANAPHILLMGGEATPSSAPNATAARASSASPATWSGPACTSCPWATPCARPSTRSRAASRTARSSRPSFPAARSCPVLKADEIDVGLDFDQMAQGRHHARLRRHRRARRNRLHRRVRPPHHQVLPARVLRLVHSLPRRHGLDQEDPHARSTRAAAQRRTSTTFSTSPKT